MSSDKKQRGRRYAKSTRRKLDDREPMPFGTHAGKPIGEVPDRYWLWFLKQPWCDKYPDLVEYAQIVEDE